MPRDQEGWPLDSSPFHAGECAIQDRLGISGRMEHFGRRIIRPYLPEQHRQFYPLLSLITVGHLDSQGWPWASFITGKQGFITSPDRTHLTFAARPHPSDPLARSLAEDLPLGFVGLEFTTRRRNRANGRISKLTEDGFEFHVAQSFGNCPQYIHTRRQEDAQETGPFRQAKDAIMIKDLSGAAADLIDQADTFFVASAGPAHGGTDDLEPDVSHRGGRPGFVKRDGDSLIIPDFSGNKHFNTLGNFEYLGKAGLLFADFTTGDLLQLTGRVEIIWEGPEIAAFEGAERAWRFTLDHGHWLPEALPSSWTDLETSPYSDRTGSWAQSAEKVRQESLRQNWRPFRLTDRKQESQTVTSFLLEPADGQPLPVFKPGQFITVRRDEGSAPSITRNYSLTSRPGQDHYRISVKRETEGAFSPWIHDEFHTDQILQVKGPHGGFVMDEQSKRPLVFIAAGVGITPFISMIKHHLEQVRRTNRNARSITLIHAARTTAERAFMEELLSESHGLESGLRVISLISQPTPNEEQGVHYSLEGRLNPEILQALLPLDDYECFLCGPSGFMQSAYDMLRGLGISDQRIHAESFGPASLKRQSPSVEQSSQISEVPVSLAREGLDLMWKPGEESLLEALERAGSSPEFGCRNGSCGSCIVTLKQGELAPGSPQDSPTGPNQALLCQSRPVNDKKLILDI